MIAKEVFDGFSSGLDVANVCLYLVSKNIYGVLEPTATAQRIVRLAKWLVPVVALIVRSGTIVALLLILFQSLILSLLKNNFVTKYGAFASIVMGGATVAYIAFENDHWHAVSAMDEGCHNVGIIALLINIIVMLLVSLITQKSYKKKQITS